MPAPAFGKMPWACYTIILTEVPRLFSGEVRVTGKFYIALIIAFITLVPLSTGAKGAVGAWGEGGEGGEVEAGPVRARIVEDGVQRVEVAGGGYFFRPDRIIVKVGVPVELTLTRQSKVVPHNFVIDSLEAGMEVDVTLTVEPKSVIFTPTRTGSYPFYCDKRLLFLKSHRARGMEGAIVVVE
jgi:plastocyanin